MAIFLRILSGMVKIGKLSQADYLKYKDHLPKVIPIKAR